MKSNSPYIIAEIASAHEGDSKLLIQIAEKAIAANADAIKLQIFNRENLISKMNPLYDEFGEIELKPHDWSKILNYFSDKDIDLIIEAYDMKSIDLIQNKDLRISFKIPASNISDKSYISKVCNFKTRIYLAVGGAKISEVEESLDYINSLKFKNEVILLCGFQNFPTKIKDSNLAQIDYLKKKFKLRLAYADHTDSNNVDMRTAIPILAYISGCDFIEKHITLDRKQKGRDYFSSLDPDEFKEFVYNIKNINTIYGDPLMMGKTQAELNYRQFSKRFAVANKNIRAGSSCRLEDFNFLRTGKVGITKYDFINYQNKEIKINMNINDILLNKYF